MITPVDFAGCVLGMDTGFDFEIRDEFFVCMCVCGNTNSKTLDEHQFEHKGTERA